MNIDIEPFLDGFSNKYHIDDKYIIDKYNIDKYIKSEDSIKEISHISIPSDYTLPILQGVIEHMHGVPAEGIQVAPFDLPDLPELQREVKPKVQGEVKHVLKCGEGLGDRVIEI